MRSAIGTLLTLTCCMAVAQTLGLGTPAPDDWVRAWDIDVAPDGTGLPPGRGSVAEGRRVYDRHCASCHGADGQSGTFDVLVGGQGSLRSKTPRKTIGSFWPYATTLFDYVRRAMPFNAPQSLTNQEVYAVVAYLLYMNALISADAALDATSLAAVRMPNRDGFVPDPRPDVR